MDHMYAATTSPDGDDVEITPPPNLSPPLSDHSFARPPSQRSQAASSSLREKQSPKTKNSAAQSHSASEAKGAVKQQEEPTKTKKLSAKYQPLETQVTVEQKPSRKRRKSTVEQEQHLEAEVTVEQEQSRKRRKSTIEQGQHQEQHVEEVTVEQEHSRKRRKSTVEQGHHQEQHLEVEVTVEQEQLRKRRKSTLEQGKPVDTEVATEDRLPAKRRRSSTRLDELLETKATMEQEQVAKPRKTALRQDQTNTTKVTAKEPSGTSKVGLRQDQKKTTTKTAVEKQSDSPVTRKDSRDAETKKTETVDSKQGQSLQAGKLPSKQTKPSGKITTKQDPPDTRKVATEQQGRSRNTRNSTTKQDQTQEKPTHFTETATCEDRLVETGKTTAELNDPEETKILSNGKNTDLSEAADPPPVKRKRGRPRKIVKESVVNFNSAKTVKDDTPLAERVPSGSAMPTVSPSPSSPLQGQEKLTARELEKTDGHSLLVKSPSQKDQVSPQGASEVSAKDARCPGETVDPKGAAHSAVHTVSSPVEENAGLELGGSADSVINRVSSSGEGVANPGEAADSTVDRISSPAEEKGPYQCDVKDGSTVFSSSAQSRFSSDDSNNNTSHLLQQEETKSSDSQQHRLYQRSAELLDTDDGDDRKTSSGSIEAGDTCDKKYSSHSASESMLADDRDDSDHHSHAEIADSVGDKNSSSSGPKSVNNTDSDDKMCWSHEKQLTISNSDNGVDTYHQNENCTGENQLEHSERIESADLKTSLAKVDSFSTEISGDAEKMQSDSGSKQGVKPTLAAKDDGKEDIAEDSSMQNQDLADATSTGGQTPVHDGDEVSKSDNHNLGSAALRRICDAVRLTPKVPQAESSVTEAASTRKRTAEEAGLNDSLSSSQLSDRSPFTTVSMTSTLSSTPPTGSPALHSSPKPTYRKASVPRADATESVSSLEKFRIPLRDHGWKRELVVRGIYDEVKCKYPPADVYYFTPDGKKLRSGVQVVNHLLENPSSLTPENFTFMKKVIFKEPWETVRHAGKAGLHKRKGSKASLKDDTLPRKKVMVKKIKILSSTPVSSDTASPSQTTRSTTNSTKPKFKPYVEDDDDSDVDVETDDEDYTPGKEETAADWNKRRTARVVRKSKGLKQPRTSPECEVLIQSIPEPEIIIDHADESLYAEDGTSKTDISVDQDGEEDQSVSGTDIEGKPPRMMLLPGDIKEESGDSGGEDRDTNKNSHLGTVYIHLSPEKRSKPHTKPTARKSTMPRITLKKKISSKPKDSIPQGGGQLCSNACPGLNGEAPSLQCSICMCLFHYVCVNVDPKNYLQGTFKCLRCRDVDTKERTLQGLLEKPAPLPASTVHTSSLTKPVSNTAPMPRVIVLRAPPVTPPIGASSPLQTLPSPLITTVPTSMLPVTSGGKMDATQLLKSLTTLSQTAPPTTAPVPVRHAPMAPPQLVKGGTASPVVRPIGYCVVPPHQARPPPRLTAAPRVAVSTLVSQPPPAFTILPTSSTAVTLPVLSGSTLPVVSVGTSPLVSGGTVPVVPGNTPLQPQMLTLPTSILSRLNLNQPLAVKLNNAQVVVPPSCLISSKDGLKVLLPPSTFPIPPNTNNTKVSINLFSNNNIITTATPLSPTNASATGVDTQAGNVLSTVTTLVSQDASGAKTAETGPSLEDNVVENQSSPEPVLVSEDSNMNDSAPPSPPDVPMEISQGGDAGGSVKPGGKKRRVDFTRCAIHRLYGGFDCMLAIFEYLSVPDLLRAGKVCRAWQKIAQERCLWHKVNLKGLRVKSWQEATRFLNSVRTRSLILQKVQPESEDHTERMKFWDSLNKFVCSLMELRHLEFGLVPAFILHSITDTLVDLETLRAEHISDFSSDEMWTSETKLDMGKFGTLTELQELRVRGVSSLALPSFTFSGTLSELASLKHLRTLSLTSVRALRDSEFSFLSDMRQLKVLELGDCLQWTEETYRVLGELCNLEHLHLECGGEIPDCGLGDALTKLTRLQRLELILFTIPASLDEALRNLPFLNTLVVWPNAHHGLSPALINSHALTAVVGLKQLTCLEWGVVVRPPAQDLSGKKPPVFQPFSIPLLRPSATLNPEVEPASGDILEVSVNDFTQRLLLSLPHTTSIKVFNTQVVGRRPHMT